MLTKRQLIFLVSALFLAQFVYIFGAILILPLGPALMKEFNLKASLLATLVTSYSFSASIFSLLCSFFIGRFDKRKLFIVSLLGFILGNIICIISHEYVLFTLGRIISGGFGGIFNIALLFLITTYVKENTRGRVLGIIMSAFSVVTTFGVPLGVYLSNLMTWKIVFTLLVSLTLLVFIFSTILLFKKAYENNAVYEKRPFKIEFKKEYILALVLNFFTILGGITVTPFVNPYYIFNLGMSVHDLPLMFLISGACTILMTQIFGFLSDKVNAYSVFIVTVLLNIVSVFIMTNYVNSFHSFAFIIFVNTLFTIFISVRFVPSMTFISKIPTKESRDVFFSYFTVIQNFSIGFAAVFGGLFITTQKDFSIKGFDNLGYIACLFNLISIILVFYLKSYLKRVPSS